MKKILSIILASAMLIALMGTTVLAGTATIPDDKNVTKGTEYWVVGKQGETGTLADGVGDPNGSATANIKINFNKGDNTTGTGDGTGHGEAIEERYAIDIEFGALLIDLTNITMPDSAGKAEKAEGVETYKFVWNVKTYTYEFVGIDSTGKVVNTTNPLEATIPSTALSTDAFKIINHSSMPIQYTATLYNNVSTQITMGFEADLSIPTPVERTLVGATEPKAGNMHTIQATPVTNWLDVINNLAANGAYAGNGGTSKGEIGTITVTIEAYVTPTP